MSDNGQLFIKKNKSVDKNIIIDTDINKDNYIDKNIISRDSFEGDELNIKSKESQKNILKTDVLDEKRKKVSDVIDTSLNKINYIIGEDLVLENPREKIANRRINNATINSMRHRIGITGEPFIMYFRRNACNNKKALALKAYDASTVYNKALAEAEKKEVEYHLDRQDQVKQALEDFITRVNACRGNNAIDISDVSLTSTDHGALRRIAGIASALPTVKEALQKGEEYIREFTEFGYIVGSDRNFEEFKSLYKDSQLYLETFSKTMRYANIRLEFIQNKYFTYLAGKDVDNKSDEYVREYMINNKSGDVELTAYGTMLLELRKLKSDGAGTHTTTDTIATTISGKMINKTYINYEKVEVKKKPTVDDILKPGEELIIKTGQDNGDDDDQIEYEDDYVYEDEYVEEENEVKEEPKSQIKEEIEPKISEEIKPQIKEEVKPQVKKEEKKEAKEKIQAEEYTDDDMWVVLDEVDISEFKLNDDRLDSLSLQEEKLTKDLKNATFMLAESQNQLRELRASHSLSQEALDESVRYAKKYVAEVENLTYSLGGVMFEKCMEYDRLFKDKNFYNLLTDQEKVFFQKVRLMDIDKFLDLDLDAQRAEYDREIFIKNNKEWMEAASKAQGYLDPIFNSPYPVISKEYRTLVRNQDVVEKQITGIQKELRKIWDL